MTGIYIITNGTANDATQVMRNFGALLIGDGSDGAFNQSSGATTLTQGTVYQYSSFTMSGTATLTTTKTTGYPIIVLVQGDLNITSNGTSDFSGKGIDSPLGTTYTFGSTYTNGNVNIPGNPPTEVDILKVYNYSSSLLHSPIIVSGTKGGNGASNSIGSGTGTGGTGGSGGASIIFVVGGNVSVSNHTFNMGGANGGNGASTGSGSSNWGLGNGGAGGGSGSIGIYCFGTLTDTGTYTVTGGNGGTGSSSGTISGNSTYSGGGGASITSSGTAGTVNGAAATTGGIGATGLAIRQQIKW